MKGRGSVGDTGDTRGVDWTRHRRFSISNTQECEVAPGALLERARDGEREKRGAGGHKHRSRSDGHAGSQRGGTTGSCAVSAGRVTPQKR